LTAQEITNPKTLFDPSPYGFSHVLTVNNPTRFIFLAGLGGEENQEGKLTSDFRTRVRLALQDLQLALDGMWLEIEAVAEAAGR
jgi:enamine deaminase RidA (YjgF/YER057c/UK114 family)